METTVKYGHLTTIYGLSTKDVKFACCLSGLGYTDSNIYIQTLIPSLFEDSPEAKKSKAHLTIKNYSNLIFQIWPKLNFEANKEYQKLLKSHKVLQQMAASDDANDKTDILLLAERIEKMEKRKDDENESNQALLESYLNLDVTYGSEIQLYHLDSHSFLNGKILCSDTDKSAYKFELSNDYGTGMIFKVFPRYKLRTEGETIQYQDQVVLYNIKLRSYVNFSCENPIEIDKPLQHSFKGFNNLYKSFDLKTIDPSNMRYEAYLSNIKNQCYWQLFYHGTPEPISSSKIKGGDLIRIRHTEYRGELAAETSFSNDFEECFLRKYKGEFSEEETSVNSIWEVEIDRSNFRGDQVEISTEDSDKIEENQEEKVHYRLRHLLSGKLLTIHDGFLPGDKKNKSKILGLMSDGDKDLEMGRIEFAETTVDNPGYCEDNGYYHLRINELYFFVDGRYQYSNENQQSFLGMTMTKMKKPVKDDKKLTDTMTNFNFMNTEESMFTPLLEKEFATERYAVLCKKERSNENAFQMIKVDDKEKQDVLFVNSLYLTLLRFINIIKANKKELLSNDLVKKVSKGLKKMIAFVLRKENLVILENLDEGIPLVSRQKILKDMRMIELLTDILFWPFRNGICDIKNMHHMDPELMKIFQLSYRLIKHGIKEYRPNEIYASQWIDLFMKQTMLTNDESNIYADVTLIELIDNNRRILQSKINPRTIEDFVRILMNQEFHEKYVKLLNALTICDGEAMVLNQGEISKVILMNDIVLNKLLFPIELREECKLFIKVYEEEFIELAKFKETSENRDDHRYYDYFIQFTNLLANLCRSRNHWAIDTLEKIYTFDICYQIISNINFASDLRTSFCRLILTLYIDRMPYIKLVLPKRIHIWGELNAEENHLLSTKADTNKFEILKGFVSSHLSQIKLEGYQKAFETMDNEFTQSALILCKNMLEFGFYKTTMDLDDLLEPLFSLLNGTKDVTTKEEEDLRKDKFKGSSMTLVRSTTEIKTKRKRRKHLHEKATIFRTLRYEETENNQILHGCKRICCEILKFVMELRSDMQVSLFLCEFKRVLENPNEINNFKGHSSYMHLSSHNKKKLMSHNFSRSQFMKTDEEEEAQSNNFLVIINKICNSKVIDFSKSVFDPIAIYLDLLQYNNESLINLSYELLITSFSKRKQLINMLKKLQILDDNQSIAALKTIQSLKETLSGYAEKTENWLGNEEDPESIKDSEKCLEILEKLNSLLKTNKETNVRSVLDEPDGEMIPRNEQISNKEQEKPGFHDCLFEKNEKPFTLTQNLMRNEYVYQEIIEILQFDIDSFAQDREGNLGLGKEIKVSELQLTVLKKCYHILARFASDNYDNQLVLHEFLKPIFLRHIKTLPEVNGGLLIDGLFKNNKSLLSDNNLLIETVHTLVCIVNKLPIESGLKVNYLECLKVMTRYKDRLYKSNQTLLIKELCSKEFSNVFLTSNQKKELNDLENIITKFIQDVEKSRMTVDLPSEILYLSSLLKILAITCQEENNATESKCQTFLPLSQIVSLLNISGECWFLKKYLMYFYFHVFLETERELNEEKKSIDDINEIIMRDLDFITDNMATNNGPSIRTHIGMITLKNLKLKFFFTLLPCLRQILMKKLVRDDLKRPEFIKKLLNNLIKMSHWLDGISSKKKAKFSNFVTYLCDNSFATDDFKLKIDKESFATKPGFKKTLININLTATGNLPHQNSAQKGQIFESIKENKLLAHVESIEKNEKFIKKIENEFEELVAYIVNVADRTEKEFEGQCTIQLEEITKALIKLISNPESTLSRDLMRTSLTIFRKMIEMENPMKTDPAVEWSNEDYEEKKGSIIKRQNQLVNLGVVKTLMMILAESNTSREVREEAVLVCIAILLGGNKNAQDAFVKGMDDDRYNQFFLGLKKTVHNSYDSIKKAMNITNKKIIENLDKIIRMNNQVQIQQEIDENKKGQFKPESLLSPDASPIRINQNINEINAIEAKEAKEKEIITESGENPMADIQVYEEDHKDLQFLRRIFRLLQLFCEGHHRKMQNFLREQTFHGVKSGTSFDFIHMSTIFFSSYIKFVNIYCVDVGNQLLDFMIEAIQGPSVENQIAFCKNKTVDVCKDFLAKFQRTSDYNKGGFFDSYEKEMVDNVVTKSSKLLFSLIEGPPNVDNLSMLTDGLDFNFILQHLKVEFCDFVERVSEVSGKRKPPINLLELNLEDFNEELPDHFDSDFLEAFNIYSLVETLADVSINKAGGQTVKEFLDNVSDPAFLKTLEFFKMNCRSIEIDFHDTIIRVYFPVHPICRFLSKTTREKFGNNVNRETPNDKVNDLVNASDDFFDEMKHLAYLQTQIIVVSSKRLNILRDLSTVLAFCINFFIIYSYSISLDPQNFNHGYINSSDPHIPIDQVVNGLGYAQLVTSCLMLILWIIINGPLILKRKWREIIKDYGMNLSQEEKDTLDEFVDSETPITEADTGLATSLMFYKGPEDEIFKKSVIFTDKYGEEIEKISKNFGNFFTKTQFFWVSARILFTNNEFLYMVFYILVSWMGVFISEIAYCLHLYDVIVNFIVQFMIF